jgi:hypothetical protein
VNTQSKGSEEAQIREINLNGLTVSLINHNGYKAKLVDDIEERIKMATEKILTVTDGSLTPHPDIQVHLTKSEEITELNRPAYATATLYNPDEIYFDDWNLYETMLVAMFNEKDVLSPFQTIGLAEYVATGNSKVVDFYSAHELWIIHRRYNTPSTLAELVQPDVFNRRVVKIVERSGTYALPETAYWMMASFSNYLIEKYGEEKFISLYKSNDIIADLEQTYSKPFEALEAEWKAYVNEIEENFPEKYNHQLEEDYQYWYES